MPKTYAGPLRLIYPSEYSTWRAMLGRCYQPRNGSYPRYGGAGIRVCKRWHTFANFIDDMGPRPPGLTIERIRNGEGYHADNCRWATKKEQAVNRHDNHRLRYKGETLCMSEWCERLGISHAALTKRLERGWPVAKALGTKVRARAGSASSEPSRPAPSSTRSLHGPESSASEVQAWLAG